jgi:diacylglycerol kinase (ATP)
MRVTLVHNESAGDEAYESRDLLALLRDCGHVARVVGNEDDHIRAAIRRSPDVIVVAGGDGTVAKVALAMHETGAEVPLFILPAGTSNNIATSLDLPDDVPALALALSGAREARLDVGVVNAPWGREHFVEGVGFGFIGTMLAREGTVRERVTRTGRAIRAVLQNKERGTPTSGVARLIRHETSRRSRVQADGEELSGEYIAVEIMNIRRIGPRVELAPAARGDDGLLDLVLVREEDREALAAYVEAGGGSDAPPPGITRRVRGARVSWPSAGGHVDDEVWPKGKAQAGDVSVAIAGSISLLLPASAPGSHERRMV